MMSVVAAVSILATAPHTWTLLLAIGVMVAATLMLVSVIGLQLGQSERPAPGQSPDRAHDGDQAAVADPAPAPTAGAWQTTPVGLFSPLDGLAGMSPTPTTDAVDQRRPPTIARLLFVVDAAVANVDELPASVRQVIDAAAEVYVVTPVLPTRLAWLADDIDGCRDVADERLDTVVGHLRSVGAHISEATIRGSLRTVIADAVAQIDPDHILIALGDSEHANWQEHGLVERIEKRFGLPLTTYIVDDQGHTPHRH